MYCMIFFLCNVGICKVATYLIISMDTQYFTYVCVIFVTCYIYYTCNFSGYIIHC